MGTLLRVSRFIGLRHIRRSLGGLAMVFCLQEPSNMNAQRGGGSGGGGGKREHDDWAADDDEEEEEWGRIRNAFWPPNWRGLELISAVM